MRISIVANPFAGRGKARSFIEGFRRSAGALGIEATLELTQGPGDGVRLARELRRTSDVIGIMGGDGTVHEVVNGLMPDPVPVVIMPTGTGNDVASLLRCPERPEDLVAVLEDGFGARLDVLDFGGRYCINSAGLGFEGEVNRHSHKITQIKGPLVYIVAVFKALNSLACPQFVITTGDGRMIEGGKLLVSISNGNRAGGAFFLTPDAYPDDGLIDVCLVDSMSKLKLLQLLPRAFNGSHVNQNGVEIIKTDRLTVESSAPYPMHIDGEFVEMTSPKLAVTILPRALPVLCSDDSNNRLRHPRENIL